MSSAQEWMVALQKLDVTDVPAYLDTNSGLPGARANLPLVDAIVILGDADLLPTLVDHGSEFSMMCAAALVSSLAREAAFEERARGMAADSRWRVREGVAIGLQQLGDVDLVAFLAIVQRWAENSDALVQRAAIASVCEPRLLRSRDTASVALDVCRITTEHLVSRTDTERKTVAARTLRQALGYCWSVAIAADPERGLAAFRALDVAHPDIAWIVAENRRKKRLSVLL